MKCKHENDRGNPNALWARLLEFAARRGEKGFSNLVREAVEAYLAGAEAREQARTSAVQVLGTLSDDDADRMAASARHARERWRYSSQTRLS